MKINTEKTLLSIIIRLKEVNTWGSLLVFLITLAFSGCKKFIEVDAPNTSTTTDLVYSTDSKAIGAMTGIYAKMSSNSFYVNGFLSLSLSPELSGDNLGLFDGSNPNYTSYYKNELNPQYNGSPSNLWSSLYSVIYDSNAVLEGVTRSTHLSSNVKNQLLAEAYFVRAFCYFYLTNLYGDVPLALTTDYTITAILSRNAQRDIYNQIISDLKAAKALISEQYLDSKLSGTSIERVRPNRFAVSALLARVYLFSDNFTDAEMEASEVIGNLTDYSLEGLNQVFQKNSREILWSIQPVAIGENTKEALFYYLPATGPSSSNPAFLSPLLMGSFEPNDQRKGVWTSTVTVSGLSYSFPTKYREIGYNAPVSEYSVPLRLAEQYLIRAEARAMQNKIAEAKEDVNSIRARAGLGESAASTKESLLTAILQERRVEFFTEWGTRWFDLKRTGQINAQMQIAASFKGITWKPSAQLYPLPQFDITRNKNLSQNPGY